MRLMISGKEEDFEASISSYRHGWGCKNAPPSVRIFLAHGAAGLIVLRMKWPEAIELLRGAIGLLPFATPASLRLADQEHQLAEFAGLATMAAAVALNAGESAY